MALAFMGAEGFKEKKQKHLIYSSIRMEINALCLSDTPPVHAHFFFKYHDAAVAVLNTIWHFTISSCPVCALKVKLMPMFPLLKQPLHHFPPPNIRSKISSKRMLMPAKQPKHNFPQVTKVGLF